MGPLAKLNRKLYGQPEEVRQRFAGWVVSQIREMILDNPEAAPVELEEAMAGVKEFPELAPVSYLYAVRLRSQFESGFVDAGEVRSAISLMFRVVNDYATHAEAA